MEAAGLPGGSVEAAASMDCEGCNLSLDPATGFDEDLKAPTPGQQAVKIEAAEAKDISEGEQMYLVSEGWWSKWCAYTRFKQPLSQLTDASAAAEDSHETAAGSQSPTHTTAEAPDSIDNNDIVFGQKLRDSLEEGKDFVIVTSESWSLLHGWYGGGPAITRTAVMEGLGPNTKRPRVMLYPYKLEVCWGGKPTEVKTIEAEKHETVRTLKERACAAFGIDPAKVEIWDYFNHGKYASIEKDLDKDLESARILDEQPILLDDKDNPLPDNNTSSSPAILTYGSGRLGRMSSFAEDQSIQRLDGRPGLVGLGNLGNTCFMNSSLQCLMHTVPILRVFLSGLYEADINTVNPLGLKGQLAMALGNLMANIWKSGVGSVMPRAFKAKIAQFAPQFSGYQQHDSQEFLAFLLDGLHEDINRIQQKPYIEEPDSEGVPDEQLAATAWTNYRLRNDSHIVDHFQGLYKSTLVCPQCKYSSVKFDPFMYLSLPLPESRVKQLKAILLHADGAAAPREYGLEVSQSGTLKDLYVTLARVAGLPPLVAPAQQMVAAKLRQGQWGGLTTYEDASQRINELGREAPNDALLVYYYSNPEEGPGGREGENKKVLVIHRSAGARGSDGKFSAPLLLWLPPSETYDPQLHVRKLGGNAQQQQQGSGGGRLLGGSDVEYALTEDAPIWQHVRRMMQPFQAPPALWQHTAAADGSGHNGPEAADDNGAHRTQQQQPAASAGAADVSMAAASHLPPSPTASPSPEPCCTSQPHGPAAAAAAACAAPVAAAGGSSCGAWGSDGGVADQTNNKAASEAGDNNSTWGSHGSDMAHSDMDIGDLGCEEAIDEAAEEAVGISRAASQQQLTPEPEATAAAAAGHGDEDMEFEGEVDAAAALAAQQLTGTASAPHNSPAAAAPGGGGSSSGEGGGVGTLVSGGVQVAPLDLWSSQTQAVASEQPSPAAAAAAGSVAAAGGQQQNAGQPQGPVGAHYVLKLARDSGESTTVASWFANHFHPHVHHFTYMLDWHRAAATRVTHAAYREAATEAGLAALQQDLKQQQEHLQQQHEQREQPHGQNQQQQPQHTAQQQQQPTNHQQQLAADKLDGQPQHKQQQQDPGPESVSATAAVAAAAAAGAGGSNGCDGAVRFWVHDVTGLCSTPPGDDEELEIVGRYVVDAMLQPQHDPSVGPINAARTDPRGKVVSLEACVEAFLQPEQLSEADEWYCPKCKTHVQADKKLDLWRLPEVLVVHLKRFSYTRWNRDKLDTQVVFPLEGLDLSRYVLESKFQSDPSQAPLYDCYAVSNHYGGLGGGHYTACAQMPDDKQWYMFDDSRVEDINPDRVQSHAAYLLFYRRRAQAQQDPPDLVSQLLHQHQQHLADKAAAAAAAAQQAAEQEAAAAREAAARGAAGAGAAAAEEEDEPPPLEAEVPDVMAVDADSTPVAAMGLAVDPASTQQDGWGSPALGIPAAAAAADGGGEHIGGALLGISSPAPAAPAPPGAGRVGTSGGIAGVDDSSDTSTSVRNTGLEEGDSSDGSSSRPRQRVGMQQRQREAAEAQAAAEAVDSWGPLQSVPQRAARPSDQGPQGGDADMADRDA